LAHPSRHCPAAVCCVSPMMQTWANVCCPAGYQCVFNNEWYSNCQPSGKSTTTQPSTPTKPAPAPAQAPTPNNNQPAAHPTPATPAPAIVAKKTGGTTPTAGGHQWVSTSMHCWLPFLYGSFPGFSVSLFSHFYVAGFVLTYILSGGRHKHQTASAIKALLMRFCCSFKIAYLIE